MAELATRGEEIQGSQPDKIGRFRYQINNRRAEVNRFPKK